MRKQQSQSDDPSVVAVLDEADGVHYLFRAMDGPQLDQLIQRWFDHGDRTWAATRPMDVTDIGFSFEDAIPAHPS